MSKHHQANRRRVYGRREHELRERRERILASVEEIDDLRETRIGGADVAVRELGLPGYGNAYLGLD